MYNSDFSIIMDEYLYDSQYIKIENPFENNEKFIFEKLLN